MESEIMLLQIFHIHFMIFEEFISNEAEITMTISEDNFPQILRRQI